MFKHQRMIGVGGIWLCLGLLGSSLVADPPAAPASSGFFVGVVVEKGETWLRVRDSAGQVNRFEARRTGTAQSPGPADPAVVRTIAQTPVGSKVIVKWTGGATPVVVTITVLVRGEGTVGTAEQAGNGTTGESVGGQNAPAERKPETAMTHAKAWKKVAGSLIYNYNPGKPAGSLMGSLIGKGHEEYFELWPDRMDRPIRVNIPRIRTDRKRWICDPRLVKKVASIKLHSRIKVDYRFNNSLVMSDLHLIDYPSGGGWLVGKVVASSRYPTWIAVMCTKDNSVYQYFPAVVEGRGVRKTENHQLRDQMQALELGTTVKIRWTTDEVRRIMSLEVLAQPDADEAVKRLGAEELNRRRAARIKYLQGEIEDYQQRIDRMRNELQALQKEADTRR